MKLYAAIVIALVTCAATATADLFCFAASSRRQQRTACIEDSVHILTDSPLWLVGPADDLWRSVARPDSLKGTVLAASNDNGEGAEDEAAGYGDGEEEGDNSDKSDVDAGNTGGWDRIWDASKMG